MANENKYADPFEAFRQKKDAEAPKKKSEIEFKVEEDGRPKGFVTHRNNFGVGIPKISANDIKPAKLTRDKFEAVEQVHDVPKPKGFTNDKVSGGIKKPEVK
ncbi:MAG: hypothetical protein HZA48_00270 [Planctomycetes bacterium]|nr:hypothetical protein [Planctomycetota bacterium]